MAKYASGLSTDQVCRLEVAECKERLSNYDVSEEDVDAIVGMIEQAYYLLKECNESSRCFEETIKSECGNEFFNKMMTKCMISNMGKIMDSLIEDEDEDIEPLPFEDGEDELEWH